MAAAHVETFVKEMWPYAVDVGSRYGLDPVTIVTQAAIETGWGREVAGNNYFGVKSHGRPGGQVITTHEEIDGQRVKVQDSFRVYDSMAESVEDYARFLHENPRYAKAIAEDSHAAELAGITRAGYATDSGYMDLVAGVSKMVAEVAPPTPPREIPNVVATELDVVPPKVAPQPRPRSERPQFAAPRPVAMSEPIRSKRAAPPVSRSGGTADLALSGRPEAVTPRLRDDGEILTYHIPEITRTAVVGGVGSLTPDAASAPERRMLPPIAPPGIQPRADDVGAMPTMEQVAGIRSARSNPVPSGGLAGQERMPPRPVTRTAGIAGTVQMPPGTRPAAADDLIALAKQRPQSYAGQERVAAASPADVPKYITRTERIEIPQSFAGQDRAKPPTPKKEIPLGDVMHHGSRDSVAQRKAGEETAKSMPQFTTRTVTELNPEWVKLQTGSNPIVGKSGTGSVSKAAVGAKPPGSLGEQFLGGLRQSFGIPAAGFGPAILSGVQNAFGIGGGRRKVLPLTSQQITAAQARPQNHNPAALKAISEGKRSYSSGGAVMPTVAMNGKVRNTYGD